MAANGNQNEFQRFLKENRSLVVSLPVLFILLVVVVVVYISLGNSNGGASLPAAAGNDAGAAQTVEILPNTERIIGAGDVGGSSDSGRSSALGDSSSGASASGASGGSDLNGAGPGGGNADSRVEAAGNSGASAIKDPFMGPLRLVGVLVDAKGDGVAVIESNSKSYIVRKGEVLENDMTVSGISADKVTLKGNNAEVTLKLERRSDSRTGG